MLCNLLDVVSLQDVLDGADTPLDPSIALAVVGACVDVLDSDTLEKVGEGGPETTSSVTSDLVRHAHPVGPLHDGLESLLGSLVACCSSPYHATDSILHHQDILAQVRAEINTDLFRGGKHVQALWYHLNLLIVI